MTLALFHIIGAAAWHDAVARGNVEPHAPSGDGFVHLSERGQILRPANLLYRGRTDLVLLVIDPARLNAEVRYEPGSHGEDELFPHLYGSLNCDAVVGTFGFRPNADGSFSLPAELD